jgi:hypothetical protein
MTYSNSAAFGLLLCSLFISAYTQGVADCSQPITSSSGDTYNIAALNGVSYVFECESVLIYSAALSQPFVLFLFFSVLFLFFSSVITFFASLYFQAGGCHSSVSMGSDASPFAC